MTTHSDEKIEFRASKDSHRCIILARENRGDDGNEPPISISQQCGRRRSTTSPSRTQLLVGFPDIRGRRCCIICVRRSLGSVAIELRCF